MARQRSAARRLFEMADLPPAVTDPPVPLARPARIRRWRSSDLSFRYAPDEPLILDDVSLALEPGQRIAILGESGAGKSTLVNLLLRFWDYDGGQILLGRVMNCATYAQTDVRAMFGVMTQRTYLFNTTIRENIHIARKDASPEEVEAAARQAEIHDFIQSLPRGLRDAGGRRTARSSAAANASESPWRGRCSTTRRS